MNKLLKTLTTVLVLGFCSVTSQAQIATYKCLLQMSNYTGEGAYIVVSLVNSEGEYEKTLYVLGEDEKWYDSLEEWYSFYTKASVRVDGITGASVTAGRRVVTTLELDEAKFNKGYLLRFESAVENQRYHITDVEIPLTPEGLAQKAEGSGYLRYVRFSKS